MDFQLKNKTVFIAGSSHGIGKAMVEAFLKEGARVIVTGRSEENLKKAKKELESIYPEENMMFLRGDFSKSNTIKKAFNSIIKKWKKLDCVIANIGSGRGQVGWRQEEKAWRHAFEVNFFSTVTLAQEAIPYFLKEKNGVFLFISSIAGCESLPAPLAYSSAKAALLSYTNHLARELAPLNIRVNVLAPGNIFFPNGTWEKKVLENKKKVSHFLKTEVPMQRFGTPEEIANATLFLASEKASFITGSRLVIDGGQMRSI